MTRRTRAMALAAAAVAMIAVGTVAVSGGEKQQHRYGGKSTIELSGRVYDHGTGLGLAGAYVIVNLRTWRGEPQTGRGQTGCSGGQVLRTDGEGRYQFRWNWQEVGREPPNDVSVQLKSYLAGWEYYPIHRRTGTSWQTPELPGPDIAMTRDEATLDERLAFLVKINDNACNYDAGAESFLELYEAQHREIWLAICTPEGEAFGDQSWQRFSTLEGYAMRAPLFAVELAERPANSTEGYLRRDAMRDRIRSSLPAFQRPGPEFSFQRSYRDLTPEEKAVACGVLDPDRVQAWTTS